MLMLDIVIGRWTSSPLDFLITASMPFLVLAGLWVVCLLRSVQLPRLFYAVAVFCSLACILYAPVCGCMGSSQTVGATIVALIFCAIFFGPLSLVYVLLSRWRAS